MKTVAAIDFGTSKIVTLLADSGGFTRCDIVGSGTVSYDGYMDGHFNTPGQVVGAIRDSISAAEADSKRRISEVYVGVPCEYFQVRSTEAEISVSSADGRVSDEDINGVQDAAADILRLEAAGGMVIHRSPAWFSVDGGKATMSPVGVRGRTLRALISFIIADPVFIEDVRRMMTQVGVAVPAFLAPSMGAALLLLPLDERDRAAVLIDIGYLNTEVSVVEGDAITYHAVLPMGGGHIAADLAMALNISLSDAEQVKREYIYVPDEFDAVSDPQVREPDGSVVTFPVEFVRRTIEATTDELIGMIRDSIKQAKPRLKPRSQVFLTGGGLAMVRGGREYLSEKLGMPVKTPMARAAKLNSPRFSSALGLIDLIFDSIEQQSPGDESLVGKLKNLIGR